MNHDTTIFEPCPICGNNDLLFSIRIISCRGLYDKWPSETVAGSVECSKCGCKLNHTIATGNSDEPIFIDLLVKEQTENKTVIKITDKLFSMFDKVRKETIERWNNRSAS